MYWIRITGSLLFVGLTLSGCGNPKIKKYKVAKNPQIPRKTSNISRERSGSTTQEVVNTSAKRMLATLFTRPERTWFFKVTGSDAQMKSIRENYVLLIKSVRFSKEENRMVTWTLPEGWEQKPGSGMRYASIVIKAGEDTLDLSVIPLGKGAGGLYSNVNRWRGQIGLSPVTPANLKSSTETLDVEGVETIIVDIGGGLSDTTGSAKAESSSAGGTSSTQFAYEIPKDWKELPAKQMRAASFSIEADGKTAEVSVIPLPGQAGGLLANVNRWRGQIKLSPTDDAGLKAGLKKIAIGDKEGEYVELLGPEVSGSERQRILGVGLFHGGKTWFFKLKGSADLVDKQKSNFEAFLKSVQFPKREGS